jgi:ribosomal protein S18 acetylase RimI-like enzyme
MRTANFHIRAATSEDVSAITALWQELMDFHQARDPLFARAADGHVRFAEFIEGRIASTTACVLVAVEPPMLVGFCLATIAKLLPLFAQPTYGAILDLAVTAAYQRQGIGQALVVEAVRWFREHQIERLEVRVSVANEVATAFWRKIGFSPYMSILSSELDNLGGFSAENA